MEYVFAGFIMAELILLPLALKWELDMKTVFLWGMVSGISAGIVTNVVFFFFAMESFYRMTMIVLLIIFSSAAALLIRFYRDDEREAPPSGNLIVAPADGRIKYIRRIAGAQPPCSSKGKETVQLGPPLSAITHVSGGYLIGVGMTFLDVHITRSPIEGKIVHLEHIKGSFFSLKRPEAPFRNERMTGIIENDNERIGLVHIASRLVRRIVSYAQPGDQLRIGQKIGMIRFGSQVDILIPDSPGLSILVSTGDKVRAGESVIATFACQERENTPALEHSLRNCCFERRG
ncbi:MAG: phosphatidylserine decarboxylase [Syntrophales bacterium]